MRNVGEACLADLFESIVHDSSVGQPCDHMRRKGTDVIRLGHILAANYTLAGVDDVWFRVKLLDVELIVLSNYRWLEGDSALI